MATDTQTAQVIIEVNSRSAESELERLKKRSEELRKKYADAFKSGNEKELRKTERALARNAKQIEAARIKAGELRAAMKSLDTASPKDLQRTIKLITAELNSGKIARGSKEWETYTAALRRTKEELRKVESEMQVTTGKATKLRDIINGWGASIAAGVAAFTGVVMSGKQAVQAYAEMEQEEANVRKYTGMTAEEVGALNDEFKKMDTRTSREELNKLAQEAGRLGKTSLEDVLGFVRAADKINVALDDLGDGATLTLSKLTGIFGDEKIYGTEQSLLKVGSVINELSQNCSASAPYLAEFASRMGGVAAQAGMTIQQVMGFGAVLDTNNQKVEASATALSQVLVRLYQDPAKYAKVAGLDVKAFADLMKKDANEALILFLTTLNQAGGMDVLSPMFKDMGENGSRAISALSTLATNIEAVKWQQGEANNAFAEGTSVINEFNVQNNTVQAGLDKARKGFQEMAIKLGEELLPVMRYCISGTSMLMRVMLALINFIKQNKDVLVTLTAALVTYHTATFVATGRLKALAVAQALTIKNHKITKGLLALLSPLWAATANGVQYLTNGLNYNYAMQQRWQKSTAALRVLLRSFNPWVLSVTAAVTALGGAYYLLSRRATAAAKAERDVNDIRREAARKTGEQMAKVEALVKVAENENAAMSARWEAINKLNKIIPGYNASIDATTGKYTASKEALKKYNDELLRSYELEGAREKLAEYGKEAAELRLKRKALEDEAEKNASRQAQADAAKNVTMLSPSGFSMSSTAGIAGARDYQAELRAIDIQLDEIKAKQDIVLGAYGEDMAKAAEPETTVTPAPEYPGGSPEKELSEEERKKQLEEAKKRLKEEAAAFKAELLAALASAETTREMALAQNTAEYTEGLKNYREYMEAKQTIELEALDEQLKIYEDRGLVEEKEYAKLLSKKKDMLLAHIQQSKKIEADALKKDYDKDTSDLTMSFFTPGSALFKKEEEFRQKLFELDIAYLEKKKLLYAEGSDERAKIEEEIEKKLNDDKLDKQKKLAAAYELFSSLYEESSDEDKKNNELSMMKALLDAKLITQEQYEEAVAKIKERYAEQDIERYRKTKSEHADMVVDMYTSFKKLFDGIAEGKFSFDNLAEAAQSAFAVMSAGLQAYSQYMSAEQDAELAKVEARYDKEIEAAGKNTKKKEKLEKQKEAETAKIKKKYNDRAMKIEIAQAIASTAMGAINAYASAASIPLVGHIIAPIAAALAVAAGMAQVATIRKQHQAEAAGYYSGGFTKRDPNNRREVGVVHANEFVANHEAVANPAVSPVLRLIDHAQRNNTIGSLTAADVSNALGQGSGVSARGAVATPLHKGASGAGESAAAVSEVLTGTRQALDNLNRSIADGIESYMVMDGARGFDRKYNDYNKLKSNPHR